MMRRYARWVAFMLLLTALGGCGGTPTSEISAITEFNKGNHFADRKGWDTAIAHYTEAIRLKPDYSDAYYNRGWAYDEIGEFDKAIKDFSEAIRLKADNARAYNNRGVAYEIKGDKAKAQADFAKAEELELEAKNYAPRP